MNLQKFNPWNWFKHEEDQAKAAQLTSNLPAEKSPSGRYPLLDLHRDIDRIFDSVFQNFGRGPANFENASLFENRGLFRPNVDVSASDDAYEIAVDVPGLEKDELSIEVHGDNLVLRGEKHSQHENKDKHFYRIERRYGTFQRVLTLPEDANRDSIQADLKNGVLNLRIAREKQLKTETKRISIH